MKARLGEINLQLHALIMKLSAVKFNQWCEFGPLHKTKTLYALEQRTKPIKSS